MTRVLVQTRFGQLELNDEWAARVVEHGVAVIGCQGWVGLKPETDVTVDWLRAEEVITVKLVNAA